MIIKYTHDTITLIIQFIVYLAPLLNRACYYFVYKNMKYIYDNLGVRKDNSGWFCPLPNELIITIFHHLSPQDQARFSKSCYRLFQLSLDESLIAVRLLKHYSKLLKNVNSVREMLSGHIKSDGQSITGHMESLIFSSLLTSIYTLILGYAFYSCSDNSRYILPLLMLIALLGFVAAIDEHDRVKIERKYVSLMADLNKYVLYYKELIANDFHLHKWGEIFISDGIKELDDAKRRILSLKKVIKNQANFIQKEFSSCPITFWKGLSPLDYPIPEHKKYIDKSEKVIAKEILHLYVCHLKNRG